MTRRVAALAVGTVVALGLAEVLLRTFVGPPRAIGQPYFRDAEGRRLEVAAAASVAAQRGVFEAVPADQTPRPRFRFAPGAHFYMCYEDTELLHDDWLDARGCVEVSINEFGLRERDTIRPDNKAADERRILCLGDSFTFAWGLPPELGWVRMLENALRPDLGNIRTINCGLSGTLTVDEYWWGLRTRFGAFRPDIVLVSIYLNDLIASTGLCIAAPEPQPTGWMLYDTLRRRFGRDPLDLDPAIDWVHMALNLPEDIGLAMGVYGPDKPFSGMWSQGAPQRALVAMRDWCTEHNCLLMVTLWPFLQGLDPGAHYPFADLHAMVGEFCDEQGIPMLDLQPVLAGQPSASLWVTPFDKHANPRAQALVTPAIAAFVRSRWAAAPSGR